MATLRRVTLGMGIRDAMVEYIGERRTKALSLRSELESQRFRSSLFNIFFEPRMSDFQGKLYQTYLTLSVELQLDGLNDKYHIFHLGNMGNFPTNKTRC